MNKLWLFCFFFLTLINVGTKMTIKWKYFASVSNNLVRNSSSFIFSAWFCRSGVILWGQSCWSLWQLSPVIVGLAVFKSLYSPSPFTWLKNWNRWEALQMNLWNKILGNKFSEEWCLHSERNETRTKRKPWEVNKGSQSCSESRDCLAVIFFNPSCDSCDKSSGITCGEESS